MSYSDIPAELRLLPQWCYWKYVIKQGSEKPTKVPFQPNGLKAAVDDPNTFSTFEKVTGHINGFDGIGFIFTANDPFCFIDLDNPKGNQIAVDRQVKIFQEFNSYSEISPSGLGLHIIIKGAVPSGRNRENVEIYSSGRYATMTGNIYHAKPIEDRSSLIMQLWEQIGGDVRSTLSYEDSEQKYTDNEIIQQAMNAKNWEIFNRLYKGDFSEYKSQSEADYALIDIIQFYSKNWAQIERIFISSELGKRDKGKSKYHNNRMINRAFDKELPKIEIQGLKEFVDKVNQKIKPISTLESTIVIPPGLIGELTRFIYDAAPIQIWEIALAASIGLMAGICGRAYNVSNTGLNQYILLLAKTGMGKEGMSAGIDKLMNKIKFQVPTANEFIGPSHIASGQALVKYVHKKSQCFVSILGEFGMRLQNMSNPNANPHERMLKQILLELYNKSGFTDIYRASINADIDKNTEATSSPAFSILAESTPSTFYSALNEEIISEGLLPRFLIIEYNGLRPDVNENHSSVQPSDQLVYNFASLVANASSLMHKKSVIEIKLSEEATILSRNFSKFATAKINENTNEVALHLWNRAHLKSLKLAALVAIGCNMSFPMISHDDLNWAISIINGDIEKLSSKFESGDVGSSSSETKQQSEVIRMIKEYCFQPWDKISKYTDAELLHHDKIIPHSYLSKRLYATSAFKNDKIGATNALKRAVQNLVDGGKIAEVTGKKYFEKYNTTQKAFTVVNIKILE